MQIAFLKMKKIAMKLFFIFLLIPGVSFASVDSEYQSILGRWEVVRVGVVETPVMALVDNDPEYMGQIINFKENGISWIARRKGNVRPDDCNERPEIKKNKFAIEEDNNYYHIDIKYADKVYTVNCRGKYWGPLPGTIIVKISKRKMILYWLDGAIIYLRKI